MTNFNCCIFAIYEQPIFQYNYIHQVYKVKIIEMSDFGPRMILTLIWCIYSAHDRPIVSTPVAEY